MRLLWLLPAILSLTLQAQPKILVSTHITPQRGYTVSLDAEEIEGEVSKVLQRVGCSAISAKMLDYREEFRNREMDLELRLLVQEVRGKDGFSIHTQIVLSDFHQSKCIQVTDFSAQNSGWKSIEVRIQGSLVDYCERKFTRDYLDRLFGYKEIGKVGEETEVPDGTEVVVYKYRKDFLHPIRGDRVARPALPIALGIVKGDGLHCDSPVQPGDLVCYRGIFQ